VRRSGRIPKEIPILLIGSDLGGKIFSESTKTVMLSRHGAGLISRYKLSPEQELVLRWPERNKETEIRIVGQIGADSRHYTYGVAFFDHVENFWEMEFPPPSPREQEFGVVFLICNVCQTADKIDDNSIEADVCATNDGILRDCKRCGSSTIWKIGQPGAALVAHVQPGNPPIAPSAPAALPATMATPGTSGGLPFSPAQPGISIASAYSSAAPADLVAGGLPASASPASFTSLPKPSRVAVSAPASSPSPATSVLTLPAVKEKLAAPGVNRRKYPRIKVNYIALVRCAERGEEFVQCEDISRGGLRFKSTSRYMEQAVIDVAAPYSSGQVAIFVPARIVFFQELPEQNLFRYGVQYLNRQKPRDTF